MKALEEDPWNKTYKIAMKKIRKCQTALCETMDLMKEIIHSLFPDGPCLGDGDPIGLSDEVIPPVSTEELERSIKRINGNRKTPGSDGVNTILLHAARLAGGMMIKVILSDVLRRDGKCPN